MLAEVRKKCKSKTPSNLPLIRGRLNRRPLLIKEIGITFNRKKTIQLRMGIGNKYYVFCILMF